MEYFCGETHSEVIVKHLEFGSIIAQKWINPLSALKMFEISHAAAFPIYRKIRLKSETMSYNLTFIKWQQLNFFPPFYDKTPAPNTRIANFELLNRKMKVYRQLFPPKVSSQPVEAHVLDYETGKPLVMQSLILVNVDPKTRRPAPFSTHYKEYFSPEKCTRKIKVDKNVQQNCLNLYEIPKSALTFTTSSTVSIRQLDPNNHLNQAEYFKLCLNCLGIAFLKSIFGNLGSIFEYNLKRMSLLYVSESQFGDSVDTICWQDFENTLLFKFHVVNPKGLACQAELEFYPKKALKASL